MNTEVSAEAQNTTGISNNVILSQRHIPHIRSNGIPLMFWRVLNVNLNII